MNQFAVHRLRSKPVEYAVRIKHFVSGGEWMMSVGVEDVAEDDANKARVADDLRTAADMLKSEWQPRDTYRPGQDVLVAFPSGSVSLHHGMAGLPQGASHWRSLPEPPSTVNPTAKE